MSFNYLSPLEFLITIKRLPKLELTTQKAEIPQISLATVKRPTPFIPVNETADKMEYGEFNVNFILDERLENYLSIFNWMHGISFPDEFSQYAKQEDDDEGLRSDISLLIKNSNKNPNIIVSFRDCWPISLSQVSLDTTQSSIQYPEGTVTFAHNGFSIDIE